MSKSLSDTETVFEFPCEFSIKAMGKANDTFEITVLNIVKRHVPAPLQENAVKTRFSADKRYLSLTVTFMAQSKQQLDAIYTELSACEHVLFTL